MKSPLYRDTKSDHSFLCAQRILGNVTLRSTEVSLFSGKEKRRGKRAEQGRGRAP